MGAGRTEQGSQLVESRQRLLLLAGDGLENVGALRSQVLRERCGITGNRDLGTGLALGVVLGVVLGLMMNNVGYGIVVGVAVDIVIGVGLNNRGGGSRT